MPSNHLILCFSLLLSPSIFSSIRVFSKELAPCIRCPKDWSLSFSINPFSEHAGLIFLLGLIGLISLLSKRLLRVFSSTIVQNYQFFGTQPSLWSNSPLYMTIGKTIALTLQTFVSKVMSLLFNMLSTFVIAFLSRSKHLLILWPQSLSAVILQPKKIKSVTVSTFSASICHEVMAPCAMILVF